MTDIFQSNRVVSAVVVFASLLLLLWAGMTMGLTGLFLFGAAIPICVAGVFCLNRPMVFMMLAFSWYALAFFSSSTYFPYLHYRFYNIFRYIDEVMLIPLFFLLAMQFVFKRAIPPKTISMLWIATLLLTMLSGYVNGSGIKQIASFIQAYLRHIVLLLVASSFFERSDRNYKFIGQIFIGLLIIQFILNVGWLLHCNPIPNIYTGKNNICDQAVGSLGSSSYVTYLTIVGLALAISFLLNRNKRNHIKWVLFGVMCVVQLFMGYTKHAIPIAMIVLLFVTIFTVSGHKVSKLFSLAMILGIMLLLVTFINVDYSKQQTTWYNRQNLKTVFDVKQQAHINVYETLKNNRSQLLGAGPGQFSSVVALWNNAPLFLRYFYHELEKGRYNPQGSIMLYSRTGFLSLYGDIGVVGLMLFLAIYAVTFWHIFRQFLAGKYDRCKWARHLAVCWCGWALLYALLNCITDYLNFGITPFITWTIAGVLWLPPDAEQKENLDDIKT